MRVVAHPLLERELGLEVGIVAVAEGQLLQPSTVASASTTRGSNCEPATRRSSATAASALTGWR